MKALGAHHAPGELTVSMNVRLSVPLRVRFWLGITLMRFAAWLLWHRVNVANAVVTREAGEQ
jgi:hypothetical protein